MPGEVPPGCWFDGAVDEFECVASVGLNERYVGVGDGQPVVDEARDGFVGAAASAAGALVEERSPVTST